MKIDNIFLKSALILSAFFNAKSAHAEFGNIDLSIYLDQSWTPNVGSEEYGTSNFWNHYYWNHTIDSNPNQRGIEGADCSTIADCKNIDTHGGIDFSLGGRGASGWIRSYGYAKCINIDDNRFNPISFQNLLDSGEVVTFNFVHSEDEKIMKDTYIAKYQLVSREGFAGTNSAHLHLEVADDVNLAYISTATAYPCPGDNNAQDCQILKEQRSYEDLNKDSLIPHYDANSPVYYNPRAVESDYKGLMPYFDNQQSPSFSGYNVFGRINEELYSTLNLHRVNPHEFSVIGVRQYSLTNAHALNRTSGANPQWFMSESNYEVNGSITIPGSGTLDAGTYLFSAGVRKNEGDALVEGYPVLFEIVGKNDIIIDNDQIQGAGYSEFLPHEIVTINDDEVEADLTDNIDVVPGYYLSAKLIKGTVDYNTSWAKWAPGVAGEYSLSVYIPNGATANSVIYRIVPDGSNENTYIETIPVDQSNGDRWIQLSSTTQENFNFTANGYVELLLSNDANPSISNDQYVAFDAVKFVYVSGSTIERPDLQVESILSNKFNLKPNEDFQISATVSNQGDRPSEKTTLHYYRSDDATINLSDTEIGANEEVAPILAGKTSDEYVYDSTAPETPGEYWIGACVEAVDGESDTENNCSTGVKITVATTVPPQEYPVPTSQDDIKVGDRIFAQCDITLYAGTNFVDEKGTVTFNEQDPPSGKVIEINKDWLRVQWEGFSDAYYSKQSACPINGRNNVRNACYFKDYVKVKVTNEYVNCRPNVDKGQPVEVQQGATGYSIESKTNGLTYYNVVWDSSSSCTQTNGTACSCPSSCWAAEYDHKNNELLSISGSLAYKEPIYELCKLDVVDGFDSGKDNLFKPYETLTRAQVSKIIVNTIKKIPSGTPVFKDKYDYAKDAVEKFDDVKKINNATVGGYNLAKYIGQLSKAGVINGYEDGINFGPNDPVKHGQLAKFIVNAILIDSSKKDWPDNCRANASDSADSEEDSASKWKNCIHEFDLKFPKETAPCPFEEAEGYTFCRYLYKLKDTSLPIYDGSNFVNIYSKDQAEKSATRGETMKAIYSSFLKRTQMSCNLLEDGKTYAESCTQN